MSQLGSTASSPFEAAAWDESSHASTIAPGGAPPHAAAPPPQPAPSRSSAPLFPPTAGQPLQPSQRPGSRDAAATTIDPHHGLPGQPPIDSPAPGGSQRPNSRGNIERLMVAVNEHRPGSQGSNRQGTSPGRNSPLGADAGLAPPWSPSAKHAPSQPSPLGSRSASPTAMGKRYGSWFVPPDDWSNVYEGEGPDPEEIAWLAAKAGVDVEGLPMLDDIEIMKRLDSRGRELQAQLKDKYLAHVYHNHLQERSLRRPEALEHAVTSAQGVDASRPASVGQSRGAGPCASLPSVEERRGSSRGARPGSPTRARVGTNESTFKGHDPEFIPPPAPVPFTPRNDDGAQGTLIPGYGAVKPSPTITYVQPSALSALDDMELDDIISPELREAVRRSLAMNDALTEHDKKMREYEESKRAAKRAARFQRDLEIAEAEAAAAGLPGLNRKQWGRLAAQHGFAFGPAGSIVAKDMVYKQSNIQVGLPRKLASQKYFPNKRRLPQLPNFKDRVRVGSPAQTKGVSIKRRASSPGVSHVSRKFSREQSASLSGRRAFDDVPEKRVPVRKSMTTYKPVSARRRSALLARGPAQAGQWGRGPRRFSTMGTFNDTHMLAAIGHLDRDGQTDLRSGRLGEVHEGSDESEEGGSGDDMAYAREDDQGGTSHQHNFAPRMSEPQGHARDRRTFRMSVLKNVAAHRLQQLPRTSPPSSPPLSGKAGGRRWSPPSRMSEDKDQLQALAQAAAMDTASKGVPQSPRELWMARQLSKATTLGLRSRRMSEQTWGWRSVRTLDDVLQKVSPRMSMGGAGRMSMAGDGRKSLAGDGRPSMAGVSLASVAVGRMTQSGMGRTSMPGMGAPEGGAAKLGFANPSMEGIVEEGDSSRDGVVSESGVQPAKAVRKGGPQVFLSDRGKGGRMKSLLAMAEQQLRGVQSRLSGAGQQQQQQQPGGQQQQQQQQQQPGGESASPSRSSFPGDGSMRTLLPGTGTGAGTSRLAKSNRDADPLPQKGLEPAFPSSSGHAEGTETKNSPQQQPDEQKYTVFAVRSRAEAATAFGPRHSMFTPAVAAAAAAPAAPAAAPTAAAGGCGEVAGAADAHPSGADPPPARVRTANGVSVPHLQLPPSAHAEAVRAGPAIDTGRLSAMDTGSAGRPSPAPHRSTDHASKCDIPAHARGFPGATHDFGGEHSSEELSPVLSACIQGPASPQSTAVQASTATIAAAPPPLAPTAAIQAATATTAAPPLLAPTAAIQAATATTAVPPLLAPTTAAQAATATTAAALPLAPAAPALLPLPCPSQPPLAAPASPPPLPAASSSRAAPLPLPHQPPVHQAAPAQTHPPFAQPPGGSPVAASSTLEAKPASVSQLGQAHGGSPAAASSSLQPSTPTSQQSHAHGSAAHPRSTSTVPPSVASESSSVLRSQHTSRQAATQRGHPKPAQEEENSPRPSSCPALGKRPAWTSLDLWDQAAPPPLLAQSSSPCLSQPPPHHHPATARSQPHLPGLVQIKGLSKPPSELPSAQDSSSSPPSQRLSPASATRTLNANSAFNSQLLVDGTPMARSHAATNAYMLQPALPTGEDAAAAVQHGVQGGMGDGHGRKRPGREHDDDEEERGYEEDIRRFLEATDAQQELSAGSAADEAMQTSDRQRGRSQSPRRATPPPLSIHVLAVLASQVHSIGRLPALDTSFGKHHQHRQHHHSPLPHLSPSPDHPKKGAAGQPTDWLVRTGLEPQVQAWIHHYQQRQELAHKQQLLEQEQQLRGNLKDGRSHAPLQLPLLAPLGDFGAGAAAATVAALHESPQASFASDPGPHAAVMGEGGKPGASPHQQPFPHPIQELERSLQQQRQEHQLKQHQLHNQLKHEQLQQQRQQQHHHHHSHHNHHKAHQWSTQATHSPWLDGAHTTPLAHHRAHATNTSHGWTHKSEARVQRSAPELPFRPAAPQEPPIADPHHPTHHHRKHRHHRSDASKRQQQPPPSAPEVQNLSLNWLRGDRVPKQKLKGDLPEEAKHLGKGAAKAWRAHMLQLMQVAESL